MVLQTVTAFLQAIPQEELLAVVVPVIVYWLYSGFYLYLEAFHPKLFAARRLHSKGDEKKKNLVKPWEVVRMVIFQQVLQIMLACLTFSIEQRSSEASALPSLWKQALQFIFACFVMDSWQYFMHRLFHESRFLYRHFHSWHHRLLVPYSYGALYNHPVEGFLLDSVGGAMSFALSGMPPRNALYFFTFATIKTVDDHCGIYTPYNPFHLLFRNNAAYHDVHHQVKGFRSNYSQPFFPFWDHLLGTYMPFDLVKKAGGGIEAKIRGTAEAAKRTVEQSPVTNSPIVKSNSIIRGEEPKLPEGICAPRVRPRRA